MANPLVVTRHPALVLLLRERGLIPGAEEEPPVIAHATADDVRGRDVIGVLPMHLAALAASVTEVPIHCPPEARGREFTIEELREWAGPAVRYRVRTAEAIRLGAEAVMGAAYHDGCQVAAYVDWEGLMFNPSTEE